MASYVIPEPVRLQYAGLYLLRMIEETPKRFLVELSGDEKVLEPIFHWLLKQKFADLSSDHYYTLTAKGQSILHDFIERYRYFLKNFDVFCAVDLQQGEFGYQAFQEFDDDEEFRAYLKNPRFDDLRLAVAEAKSIDPTEVVLMSFMNENRFGESEDGWDYDLLLGRVWDEIALVCSTAIRVSQLSYSDGKRIIKGEDVILDIITQGEALMNEAFKA